MNAGATGLGEVENLAPRAKTPGFGPSVPQQGNNIPGGFVSSGGPRAAPSPTARLGARIEKQKSNHNVYETLGFPQTMTFGHRLAIRETCERFLRYSYLIDFLA